MSVSDAIKAYNNLLSDEKLISDIQEDWDTEQKVGKTVFAYLKAHGKDGLERLLIDRSMVVPVRIVKNK